MNRTAKILSVVLALALVFGAIAIVSSADEIAGITTKVANFDAMDPSYTMTAAEGNPSGTGLGAFTMSGRAGTVSVGLSEDGQEKPNQYLVITESKGSGSPYWGTGYGGANLAGRPTAANGVVSNKNIDVADHPYLIMDLDVMSPTAKWSAALGLQVRTFKTEMADGKDVEKPGIDVCEADIGANVTTSLAFKSDENGTYLTDNSGAFKKYVNPYEFTHVTVIYEAVARDDFRSINLHVYVDGEYFYSYEGKDAAGGKGIDGYYAQTPNLSYDEIRFNWSSLDDTYSVGMDNVTTRFFNNEYEGNLAEVLAAKTTLEAWDANIYDEANMPVGKAVAKVGDKMYETLDKAIAEAPANGTIDLLTDVPGYVTVSKFLTINLNGFTADVRPGDGFAIDTATEGVYKVINSAGMTTAVMWDLCMHEPMCEDESMHPLYFEDELAINEKILAAYNPSFSGYIGDDGKIYVLIGWLNGMTGEEITADTVVTEADVEMGFILVDPVYAVAVKNYEYVKGGETLEAFDGEMTLAQVIAAADAGSTVKLFSDIEWANTSTIAIGKKLTLDLNGYTIKACREGSKAKTSLFSMSTGTDLTVMSSQKGGKIFNEGWNSATGVGAAGMFNWGNDNAILRINGNDAEGNPTLALFSGNIVQGYSSACEYHIDGGIIVSVVSDQMGLFDSRKAGRDASVKNALIYNYSGNGTFGFGGRNTATDEEAHVVVDNCVILGHLTGNGGFVAPQTMTVTNSYITGDINVIINASYKTIVGGATAGQANVPGTVILGNGNYIGGKVSGNVEFAEGVKLYEVDNALEVTYPTHEWKASADFTFDASSFEIKEATQTYTFTKITTDVAPKFVTVTWKDAAGNVIGQSEAVAGKQATPPADLKASTVIIPGWLNGVPAEWNESLVIPEDVEEYVITAKEGGALIPAAAVELFLNIRLNTHFEYRLYVPTLAEGIEITSIKFNSADRVGKYESNYGKFTIDGKEFSMVDGWPGLLNGATGTKFEMTFTYEGATYSVTKTVNIVDYCNYILDFEPAEGQLDYSADAKALAVNTANYLYNALTLLGKTDEAAKAKPIVEEYADLINKLDKENLPEVDVTEIAKYISGASLYVDTYSVYYKFDLTEAGKAADIKISSGATGGTDTEYKELGYIYTNQTHIDNLNKMDITITEAAAEGEEAAKVVKAFTIADYYALLAGSGANEATLNAVEAMYAYAVAYVNYVG